MNTTTINKVYKNNLVEFGNTPQLPYSVQEAVNRLRINISFLGSDVRKIMIVSSEPNEGKSFVAINLWNQMAEAGEKTILIDADMRNSTMYRKYDLHRTDGKEMMGTSHLLAGTASFQDVVVHTIYGYGDLMPNVENIINPSMLLEKEIFGKMLDQLAQHYRYVFIDAPPLGLVSDGEKIGNLCDGAILCVRSGVTPKSIVREAVRQLDRAGCPLLGVVLNRVDESKGGYYGRYGRYGRYGKYGSKYGQYYGNYYGTGDS
jgi:capsular exopolysaccharide synthesis family protein